MGNGSIFSNEGAMSAAAASFAESAGRMQAARSSLKAAADNLAAAWKGEGSQRYEAMKDTTDAYCVQMAEMAMVEAGNIRAASSSYAEADAAAARIVESAGR